MGQNVGVDFSYQPCLSLTQHRNITLFISSQTQHTPRFSGAQHHHYLLDLFQSVAKRYREDGRAADLVLDLLKLQVPELFAVHGGGEKDKEVRRKFSNFLRDYICRCHLKHTILKKMNIILVSDRN